MLEFQEGRFGPCTGYPTMCAPPVGPYDSDARILLVIMSVMGIKRRELARTSVPLHHVVNSTKQGNLRLRRRLCPKDKPPS